MIMSEEVLENLYINYSYIKNCLTYHIFGDLILGLQFF